MKALGIVRNLDHLGRVVLPKELRDIFDMPSGTPVEIFVEAETETIVLRKYTPGCIFCGDTKDVKSYKNKLVCEKCKKNISEGNNGV
jgi:transcriptional pleiotropic regulator of transition state genes